MEGDCRGEGVQLKGKLGNEVTQDEIKKEVGGSGRPSRERDGKDGKGRKKNLASREEVDEELIGFQRG
uniref:Uncharacterized protein n=1 Tax=Cucumis melo TaxID=3656 RepID=A0A9I9DRK1_CUCME